MHAYNYGDITVLADGIGAEATGIYCGKCIGTVYVLNNGQITVTADESYGTTLTAVETPDASATGINAVSGRTRNDPESGQHTA